MPAKIVWNDELDNALRKLRAEGVNRDDCADIMGISWPTLRKRCRELGIAVPKSQELRPTSHAVLALHHDGLSYRQIAILTGLSYHATTAVLWRARKRGEIV